jgi:hypothetical protein
VIRSQLAGYAWRAAFHSFDDDFAAESGATTGRKAGEQDNALSLALDAGQLASQRESLNLWARRERALADTTPEANKRAICCWLWRSLVPTRSPGANAARARLVAFAERAAGDWESASRGLRRGMLR